MPISFVRQLRLVLFLVCVFAPHAFAQPPADKQLSGVVLQSDTHAPLPGVDVSVNDRRTVTDREGRFTLRVPASLALVELTLNGFYPLATTIDVRDADVTTAELLLVPRSTYSSSVDVVAAQPTVAAPTAVAVASAEVLRTPGALDNVFRTLQTLPGVSATEEFGSRIAVRGGAPDQNLTLMDGVEIHDPYRLFGLTSAFNPETISRFELATGGFSPKYGDRLSSLLLVENREGTRTKRLDGAAALSITDANVVLEGKLPAAANGSWLVSARRTYYDLVASKIVDQDFPRFNDLQTKLVWDLKPGRTLSFFGLRSRQTAALNIDQSDAQGEFNDNTKNDLASLRLDSTLGSTGQSHTTVSYSESTSTFGVSAQFDNRNERSNAPDDSAKTQANVAFTRELALQDVSLRQEFSWAIGQHVLETGGELHHLNTDLSFLITGDRNPAAVNGSSQQGGAGLPDSLISTRNVDRGGVWLTDRWQPSPNVSLEGGLRIDRSGQTGDHPVSPRLTASFGSLTKLRASVGRYTQSPGYEKLIQSDYVLDLTTPEAARLRSESALQSALGLERTLGTATLRVEGYYKRLSQQLVGRLETEAERQARISVYDFPGAFASSVPTDPIITTSPTNDGSGHAYGFDVFVSRTSAPASARVRGWASYTWGKAERKAYGRTFPFEYDRRHALSAVVSYRLSDHWEIASTTRVASGFPRTPAIGLRVASTPDTLDRDRDGNVTELVPAFDPNGLLIYTVSYGGLANLNTGRLPVFAREDVRMTWRPRGAQGRWEFYAEVINLLDRNNAGTLDPRLQYDPTSDRPKIVDTPDQGIPRLPTLGIRFRF